MSTLERLRELELQAKDADDIDERCDTHASFEFSYALQKAWPKLLALIEAADRVETAHDFGDAETLKNRIEEMSSALSSLTVS